MKLLSNIFLFIFATAAAVPPTVSSQLPNVGIEGRITRGNYASEGQFPYQVGLLLKGSNPNIDWCGGSLIAIEWVLTAAHCLEYVDSVTVFLGSTVRQQAEEIRFAWKKDFIIHHGYNGTSFTHDIALIKIPTVALSWKIQTIQLPSILSKISQNYMNEYAIASGWGRTSYAELFVTKHLQWARLRITFSEVCHRAYYPITKTALCLATEGGVSSCNGDSGGPLVLNGILIGACSFHSPKGCELDIPVGYVRLTNYLNWIYKHTGIYY